MGITVGWDSERLNVELPVVLSKYTIRWHTEEFEITKEEFNKFNDLFKDRLEERNVKILLENANKKD